MIAFFNYKKCVGVTQYTVIFVILVYLVKINVLLQLPWQGSTVAGHTMMLPRLYEFLVFGGEKILVLKE